MNEFIQQILNILTGGAVAENAPVMTAAGWKSEDGEWVQKPDKDTERLGENLTAIGEAAATAPTLVDDVGLVVKAVRHPVRAARAATLAAKDLWWSVRHPGAVQVYHGTRYPELLDLRDATPYSANNIGVHVTPHEAMAGTFDVGNNGHVLEAWIPKHDMETIDIGYNDYRLLSNNFTLKSRNNGSYYYRAGNPKLEYRLLRKYGREPREMVSGSGVPGYELDNDVTLHLLDETWPDAPASVRKFSSKIKDHSDDILYRSDEALNKEAAELFSNNGKKVIKYNNDNPFEVLNTDGTAYMVTDPNVFYIPGRYSLDFLNMVRYPAIATYNIE